MSQVKNNNHNAQKQSKATKAGSAKQMPRVTSLQAGDKIYGHDGKLLFRVDPQKKAASAKAGHAAFLRAIAEAKPRNKPAKELGKRKAVVRNDYGLSRREERIARRVAQLQKRVGRRRHARSRRGARTVRSTNVNYDVSSLPPPMDAPKLPPPPVEPAAAGESFWGGILDSAVELAPHLIPLVAGMGDYSETALTDQILPKTNSLAAAFSDGEMCAEVPAIHNIGSETRFTHREYIGDVYASEAAFTTLEFPVNPGMNETFPWASRSAVNYEQYAMLGAMFCFETEASIASTPLGQGFVALGSQYDVAESAFLSKKEMFQSQFSVARRPSESFAHWIECNPEILVLPKKFVRSGTLPVGIDPHLYDHCVTTLAVGGQPVGSAGSIIGELWLTYDLIVTLPRSDETTAHSVLYTGFSSTGATVTQATPLGTAWTQGASSTYQLDVTASTVTFPANFPAGNYVAVVTWSGTGGVNCVGPSVSINAPNTSAISFGPGLGVASASFAQNILLTLSGAGRAVLTFGTTTWAGPTGPSVNFQVFQKPIPLTRHSDIFDWGGAHQAERFEEKQRKAESKPAWRSDPELFLTLRSCVAGSLMVDSSMQAQLVPTGEPHRSTVVKEDQLHWLLCAEEAAFIAAIRALCPRG